MPSPVRAQRLASQAETLQGRPVGQAWGTSMLPNSWSFPKVRTHLHLNIFYASLGKIAFALEKILLVAVFF